MSKFNELNNLDKIKATIEVGAGVSIRELNQFILPEGFEFPIYLMNEGVSTIGGMIAMNSSNFREIKYGKVKDWIEEIEFVNGKGEIIKTTKADIGDVCGMEGITGIILSAKLKLII
jgi:FAD/FMN-containing dehydrogenase